MRRLLLVNGHFVLLPVYVAGANVNRLLHLTLTSCHQEVQGSKSIDCESVEHLRSRFWNNSGSGKIKRYIHTLQRLEQALVILYVPDHCLGLGPQVHRHTMRRTDKASDLCSNTIQQLRQVTARKTGGTSCYHGLTFPDR